MAPSSPTSTEPHIISLLDQCITQQVQVGITAYHQDRSLEATYLSYNDLRAGALHRATLLKRHLYSSSLVLRVR